jgi:diguanylate cyclase (GGDEF)-like protein
LIQKTIYGITQAAIADKGINDLYHSIHSFIGELIPAENFYIALLDPATNLISFPYYVDQYDQAPIGQTPLQGFTGYVIRTGKPLLANQEVTDRLIQKGEVEVVGTLGEDWMGTPLKMGERIIGVMAVQSYSKAIHFKEEDQKFFEFVSTQVAQAIDRKQRENESFFIGTHDQLTGLYNRTFFEEEISRLEKSRHFPVSIFMFDVDDLKTVNDTQGHPAGDELLKRAANVLKESFRPEDMVARIGGDEYVAILPRTTKETAKLALERVKHFLERNNKNNQNKLRISIGIATCEKQSSLAETLKQADDRMYLDKRSKG